MHAYQTGKHKDIYVTHCMKNQMTYLMMFIADFVNLLKALLILIMIIWHTLLFLKPIQHE